MTLNTSKWNIYIIRCTKGTLYTGITTDVERRFREHAAGKGARYLRGRGPLELVFRHALGNQAAALIVEARVKKLSRQNKESLINGEITLDETGLLPK